MSREPRARRLMAGSAAAGALGLLLLGLGLLLDPRQAYFSYLTAYATGVSITVGALMLVMIGHLTGAAWLAPWRPLAEAIAATGPVFGILFLPIVAGLDLLYPWVPPLTDLAPSLRESVEAKQGYLDVSFFLARAVLYFALWIAVGHLLRRWSLRSGGHGPDRVGRRARALSAGALPAVALTSTFAAFDWLMSLSPEWFSTIYGVYVVAGGFLAALAALAALDPALSRAGTLAEAPADSFHALGKLLLTMVIFWAYIGFSQYLIIWIADVPVEVTWYVARLRGSWAAVAALLLAGNFLAPFLLLLFRRVKRAPGVLAGLGLWLLLMHYLDVYWLVMPALHPGGVRAHWLDPAGAVGVSGITLGYVVWLMGRLPPAAERPRTAD